jgi:hypothetical protein
MVSAALFGYTPKPVISGHLKCLLMADSQVSTEAPSSTGADTFWRM